MGAFVAKPRTGPEPPSIPRARWIALTQDQFALVDEEDFERINQHKWCYIKGRHTGYAQSNIKYFEDNRPKWKRWQMHNVIMNTNQEIDHRDGDGLNNRKSNLRLATGTSQRANTGKYKTNTSGFKGVFRNNSPTKPWRAQLRCKGKYHHLGTFKTREEAARAYDAGALRFFGEFARTNFPKGE